MQRIPGAGSVESDMKTTAFTIIISLLLCARALAVNPSTLEIEVTVKQPPAIGGFLPADGTVITENDTLNIAVTATDPNRGDVLRYRYYINDQLKRDWTTDHNYSYALTANDLGLNKIKADVTDGTNTVTTREVEAFVFRKSPATPGE